MEEVLVDRSYFESSGGGVTFSGGEPTLHPLFIDSVLDLCAAESIHTNLETSGTFAFQRWEPLLRKLDLIYFDLKLLDPELHKRHLGGGHAAIARNARYLAEGGFPVEFRLPLIPGYTDTRANIERVIERLATLKKNAIHLLEYHSMGETKIDIIQGKQPKLGLPSYSDPAFDSVVKRFEAHGIEVLNGR
jgi:pyruvate formate lyase activating enzyme